MSAAPRWTDEGRDEALVMRDAGHTNFQIAEWLGRSVAAIRAMFYAVDELHGAKPGARWEAAPSLPGPKLPPPTLPAPSKPGRRVVLVAGADERRAIQAAHAATHGRLPAGWPKSAVTRVYDRRRA